MVQDFPATPDPVLNRCWSHPGADEQPRQGVRLLTQASGAAGMVDRVQPGLLCGAGRTDPEARYGGEVPGTGET